MKTSSPSALKAHAMAHNPQISEVPAPINPRYKLLRYGTRGQWGIMDRLTMCWKEGNLSRMLAEAVFCAYRSEEMPGTKIAIVSAKSDNTQALLEIAQRFLAIRNPNSGKWSAVEVERSYAALEVAARLAIQSATQ